MVTNLNKSLAVIIAFLHMVNNSYAQDGVNIVDDETANEETIVYGSAKEADGGSDSFIVEQPKGASNPLGDPIITPVQSENEEAQMQSLQTSDQSGGKDSTVSGVSNQLQQINPNTPQGQEQLGNDFQNTLMEANGMVYDVQAYPEEDLEAIGNPSNPATLYSPNVNP